MVEQLKRKIRKRIYLAVVSIVISIFLIGVIIGMQFGRQRSILIEQSYEALRADVIGLDLTSDMFKEIDICELPFSDILKDKVKLGNEVTRLEERLGKNDKEVLIRKEFYQLVEIKTLQIVEEAKNKCNLDLTIIQFFYTNDEKNPEELDLSERQGYVLDDFYERFPDNVIVFAFDINTDNPALNTLRHFNKITKAPTLIIDGAKKEGFVSLGELIAFVEP